MMTSKISKIDSKKTELTGLPPRFEKLTSMKPVPSFKKNKSLAPKRRLNVRRVATSFVLDETGKPSF